MTDKDLKLLKLRDNIIDDFLEVWGLEYNDETVLTDLCLLTEHIIYKDDDYSDLEKQFLTDLIDFNAFYCDELGFDDETDMYQVLSECLYEIIMGGDYEQTEQNN